MPVVATSVHFAAAARRLAGACRAHGLDAPGFRSPPRDPGADRTLRRRPDGGVTVAVRVRGRPLPAVLVDLVEGVIVANRLTGAAAEAARTSLLASLDADADSDAAAAAPPARAA